MGQMTFDFEADDNTPVEPQKEVEKIEDNDKKEITEKTTPEKEKKDNTDKKDITVKSKKEKKRNGKKELKNKN